MVAPVPCARRINQIVARSVARAPVLFIRKKGERGGSVAIGGQHTSRSILCTRSLLDDTRVGLESTVTNQQKKFHLSPRGNWTGSPRVSRVRGSDGWPRLKLISTFCLPSRYSRATANEAIPLSSEVSPLRTVLAHLHPLPLNGMEYVSPEKNVGGLNRSGKSSRQCRGCVE